jgi:hypothetical protein
MEGGMTMIIDRRMTTASRAGPEDARSERPWPRTAFSG